MMKRLVMIFVFLTSITYSGVSVSNDVAVSTTTGAGVMYSWVVKDDDIYFCEALEFHEGIVNCIKATETNSN
jgi:hypothetical protein